MLLALCYACSDSEGPPPAAALLSLPPPLPPTYAVAVDCLQPVRLLLLLLLLEGWRDVLLKMAMEAGSEGVEGSSIVAHTLA